MEYESESLQSEGTTTQKKMFVLVTNTERSLLLKEERTLSDVQEEGTATSDNDIVMMKSFDSHYIQTFGGSTTLKGRLYHRMKDNDDDIVMKKSFQKNLFALVSDTKRVPSLQEENKDQIIEEEILPILVQVTSDSDDDNVMTSSNKMNLLKLVSELGPPNIFLTN